MTTSSWARTEQKNRVKQSTVQGRGLSSRFWCVPLYPTRTTFTKNRLFVSITQATVWCCSSISRHGEHVAYILKLRLEKRETRERREWKSQSKRDERNENLRASFPSSFPLPSLLFPLHFVSSAFSLALSNPLFFCHFFKKERQRTCGMSNREGQITVVGLVQEKK